LTLLCCTLLAATVAPSAGNAAGSPSLPDLRGVWETVYATPSEGGRLVRASRYEITRQDGELFWGVDAWHPVDPATGKVSPEWIRAPFTGSLSPAGDRGVIATEGVQFAFRLKGTDEIELEMASFKAIGGLAPTAFYAVLKRGAVGAMAPGRWPDLSGSWRGRCLVALPGRLRPSGVRLDLVRQDGELIWMDNVWSPSGPVTPETDPKSVLKERIMGSFNPEGTGGVLAKKDVAVRFRLLAPDLMEARFVRIGGEHDAATAFSVLLRRGTEEAAPAAVNGVDLVGEWRGPYRFALPDRAVNAAMSLVITRQEGNALWGEDVWTQPGENGAAPVAHRDPLAGYLAPDGTQGALAKNGAGMTFRLLDADRLELTFTSVDDDPASFFAILTKRR
jgi:hypothetical protein